MYDVIIIGAGPAGLTSALYALRANKKVLVLEAKSYGGQIINASNIENYPGIESISGFQFATNLYNQVKKLSGIIKFEVVLKIKDAKINIGIFIQNVTDFLIIALCVFLFVKFINVFKHKEEKKLENVKKEEVVLLEEIRDLLKKNNKKRKAKTD